MRATWLIRAKVSSKFGRASETSVESREVCWLQAKIVFRGAECGNPLRYLKILYRHDNQGARSVKGEFRAGGKARERSRRFRRT